MEDALLDSGGGVKRKVNRNGKTGPLRKRGKNHHVLQSREDVWNADVRYSKDGRAQSVDTGIFNGMSVEKGDYYEDYEKSEDSVDNFDLESLTWEEREEIEEKYRNLGNLVPKRDSGRSTTTTQAKDDGPESSLIAIPLKALDSFEKGVQIHQHSRLRPPDPPEYPGGEGDDEDEDERFKYALLNGGDERYVYDLTKSSKYEGWEDHILPEMAEKKRKKRRNPDRSNVTSLEEFLRTMVRICRSDCLSMRLTADDGDGDDQVLLTVFRIDEDRDMFYLCVRMYVEVRRSSSARYGIPESIYGDEGISLSIDYPPGDKDPGTKKTRESILELRVGVRDYYYFDCPCRK